jgi:transcriptional regulator with XRE-family HTH domain
MDYLNQNISINLKRIRLARGCSLDEVAEQTGVSKSMLGQIERGTANPTIGILGKIVSGLRVELTDLVGTPEEQVYPVSKAWLIPTKEVEGQYRVYTYFPYEKERNFELYTIEVEPGAVYMSGAHGEKTREYVMVQEGTLDLEIGGARYCVAAGDAIRFDTDQEHGYYNRSECVLRMVCVFYYPA